MEKQLLVNGFVQKGVKILKNWTQSWIK